MLVAHDRRADRVVWPQRMVLGLTRHWLAWVNLAWGAFVVLPWLAPVLMAAGLPGLARAIYGAYSLVCHQLANRSFFLFGPRLMYSFQELVPLAPGVDAWSGLRAFIGAPELGYKVAWSDRMAAMYGGIFLAGLVFVGLRRRLRSLKWWAFILLSAPLAIDGVTHAISDLWGIGNGFRYQNVWLANLTAHALPQGFYAGAALGSFNSLMRLATGLLFGSAVVWTAYPALESTFGDARRSLESSLGMEMRDVDENP
jgi:uncharacterized membrane protein